MVYSTETITAGSDLSRFKIKANGHYLSFAEVINEWEENPSFQSFYASLLSGSSHNAIYWEHPPITLNNIATKDYECSIRPAKILTTYQANPKPYASYFNAEPVVTFLSLGKDCRLITPCPHDNKANYTHLLSFLRTAPAKQKNALWQTVSREVKNRLSQSPLYLSTHGTGVAWLHIRLDERPKYYGDKKYKSL